MSEEKNQTGFFNQLADLEVDGPAECCEAPGVCLKSFWVLILLATVVPLYYYNNQIFASYMAKTSVTSIDEVRENMILFPNITLCLSSMFNASFIKSNITLPPGWNQWNMAVEYILETFAVYIKAIAYQSYHLDDTTASRMEKIYAYNFDLYTNQNAMDINEWLTAAAFSCQSVLQNCFFLLKSFPCCDNSLPVLSDYGICWQLKVQARDNHSSDAYQTMAGVNMGSIVSSSLAFSQDELAVEDEFNFRLHVGDTLNPLDTDINSVIIGPKLRAMVRLDPTNYVMDPNVEKCMEQPLSLAYHDHYNPGLCSNDCLLNVSMETCGCGAPGYGAVLPSDKVCSPKRMQECFLPLQVQQKQNKNKQIAKCVSTKCLPMCQRMSYQPYVTFTGLNSASVENGWFMQMMVYFGDIKYTLVQSQLLMDINGLAMGIGGVCGLWTGMSVISVVQLVAYIIFCPLYRKAEKEQQEESYPKSVKNQKHYCEDSKF